MSELPPPRLIASMAALTLGSCDICDGQYQQPSTWYRFHHKLHHGWQVCCHPVCQAALKQARTIAKNLGVMTPTQVLEFLEPGVLWVRRGNGSWQLGWKIDGDSVRFGWDQPFIVTLKWGKYIKKVKLATLMEWSVGPPTTSATS